MVGQTDFGIQWLDRLTLGQTDTGTQTVVGQTDIGTQTTAGQTDTGTQALVGQTNTGTQALVGQTDTGTQTTVRKILWHRHWLGRLTDPGTQALVRQTETVVNRLTDIGTQTLVWQTDKCWDTGTLSRQTLRQVFTDKQISGQLARLTDTGTQTDTRGTGAVQTLFGSVEHRILVVPDTTLQTATQVRQGACSANHKSLLPRLPQAQQWQKALEKTAWIQSSQTAIGGHYQTTSLSSQCSRQNSMETELINSYRWSLSNHKSLLPML